MLRSTFEVEETMKVEDKTILTTKKNLSSSIYDFFEDILKTNESHLTHLTIMPFPLHFLVATTCKSMRN